MASRRWKILGILLAIPLMVSLALWGILRHGIEVERLNLAGIEVEGLYLKLDNKLVLKARKVFIKSERADSGPEALQEALRRLHRGLEYVEDIQLQQVRWGGEVYRLLYRDGIIYLYSPRFEAAGMVYDRGKEMEVQFPLVRIPRYDVTLSGELHYRYADGRIDLAGFYQVPDLSGEFRISKRGERIHFRLDSMPTGSLQRLLHLITMSREAKEWLRRRIHARSYRLEYLEGEGRYDTQRGEFIPRIDTLSGAVTLQGVRIRFHDKLMPITARSARVVLKGGNLYFVLRSPRYGKRKLDGSHAALINLNDPKHLTLLLRLYYRGRVDWQVLRILQAYGLPVELGQKKGKAQARVDLDIPLVKGRVKVRGIVRFSAGILEFRKRLLHIQGAELAFNSRQLQIRRLRVREPWFHGSVSGRVELLQHRARLKLDVQRLRLAASREHYLQIGKQELPVTVRWSQGRWHVRFPTLKSTLILEEPKRFRLSLEKLSLWRPYLHGLFALVEEGSVKVEGTIGGAYRITGVLRWSDSPFYTRSGPVKAFDFQARTLGDTFRFDAMKGRLSFRSDQRVLWIKDLNVDAKRLIKLLKEEKSLRSSSGSKGTRLTVLGRKSIIRYDRYVLLSDTYRLEIQGDRIRFDGTLGRDHVWLEKEGPSLRIEAQGIGDRMLHALIHFNGLQEGHYTLHLQGSESKGYTGEILIDGGVLRNVKAYNDMIALFNTLPALVSFSRPGFSPKGFEIRKGRVLFGLSNKKLRLESILLEGRSATIVGKGWVDLDEKRLHIDLAVRTAREVGKALGKIPVVGYILFGKDQSITIGVKVRGTLQKPKVSTNPVGEALLYPLELLKRTLNVPMGMEEERREPPQPPSPKPRSQDSVEAEAY